MFGQTRRLKAGTAVTAAFEAGGLTVPCVVRAHARARRITCRIDMHPELRLRVTVPVGADLRAVANFLREKEAWVAGRLERHAEVFRRVYPSSWKGPRCRPFGESFLLQIRVQEGSRPAVARQGRSLVACVSPGQEGHLHSLVEGWYLEQARRYFSLRVERLARPRGLSYDRIFIWNGRRGPTAVTTVHK